MAYMCCWTLTYPGGPLYCILEVQNTCARKQSWGNLATALAKCIFVDCMVSPYAVCDLDRLTSVCRQTFFKNVIHFLALYCLNTTDLKLIQLIWKPARGRHNDEMTRLGVWHIPYSRVFYLPQHRTPFTRRPLALCYVQSTGCWVSADVSQFWSLQYYKVKW